MKTYINMRSVMVGEEMLFRKKTMGKSIFLKVFLNIYSNPAKNKTGAAVKLSLFKGKNALKSYSSVYIDPDELDEFIHFIEDALLIYDEYTNKVEEPSIHEATFHGKRFLNGHAALLPIGAKKFGCESFITFSGGKELLTPKKDGELLKKLLDLLKEEQTYQKMRSYEAVGA